MRFFHYTFICRNQGGSTHHSCYLLMMVGCVIAVVSCLNIIEQGTDYSLVMCFPASHDEFI